MSHRQTKASRCSVVKHINRIAAEAERLSERLDRGRQCLERVLIFSMGWYFCEPKTRQVRRDHAVAVCQTRNELAKHERRCWEAMEQQNHWSTWIARRPVEDFDTICIDLVNRCQRDGRLMRRFGGTG